MLPWLWAARDRLRLPAWYAWIWTGWLVGQVLTDIAVGSAFVDYARGWAAIGLTLTNVLAFLTLASSPRRALIATMGLSTAGVLAYAIVPNAYAASDPWKWGLALPLGYALAAGFSVPLVARRRLLAVVAFVVFGLLNVFLGFRSLGGVSLLAGLYLLFAYVAERPGGSGQMTAARAVVTAMALVLSVAGILYVYDAAASRGLLGIDAQAKYEMQSGELGVLVGGRPEFLVAAQAVLDSPILGHGSWASDPRYVDFLTDRLGMLGYEIGRDPSDANLIPAHSYLMGSWVWAGLLGGLFWLGVATIAARLLLRPEVTRLELAPLLVYSVMLLLWNIAFSPYGFTGRITAAHAFALCLLGLRMTRKHQTEPTPRAADIGTR
jgi:hypothetical protein